MRIARATDDDKSKAASEAQSAPLPKDSTSALSWNQSIGSNSGAITNSAVGVANPWSKADPYELVKPAPKTEPTASAPPEVAMAGDTNASPAAPRGWESPAPTTATKLPSSSATLLLPTRAIAGQFLTASVLDSNHNGEQSVELSFNGAALLTDNKGQAVFMVPEDATPGRSLTIALASRPDLNPGVVDILQPLTIPDHQETPKIDRVSGIVSPGGTATIEGHNFDGQSDHNRVLVDGAMECKVTAASPVHLKALLPDNVPPGQHSISVVISGLKSNATPFIAIGADVHADPREAARDLMTKLIVRVVGTELKVNVHIRNLSPDVIKLTKGNEFTLASPGGANNSFVLGAQRLKKGNFKVEALVQ